MSADLQDAPTVAAEADTVPWGTVWRTAQWLVVVAAGVALLGGVALLRPPPRGAVDPEHPKLAGAQAVARVLADHGVRVDVVRSIGGLTSVPLDASTTVLIAQPDRLSRGNARRAADATQVAGRTVLLGPGSDTLRAMGIAATATVGWASSPVPADCTSDIAHTDDAVQRGSRAYRPAAGSTGWTPCFTEDAAKGAARMLTRDDGAGHEVVLIGFPANLSNGLVGADDNAGVFVRALGHSAHLVWYVPGATDLADAAQDKPGLQYPSWFWPLVYLLGSAVVLLAFLRGRRLGRVVPEPLAVVVRAVETTENRGRLYRRAGDAPHAGAILQDAARTRLRQRFGVGRHDGEAALIEAVSRTAGLPSASVHAVLYAAVPPDDSSLLRLAQQLSDLEEQVRTA